MGLLLLKLWVIGLDCKLVYILGKTVQDMVLERFFRQIASDVVLKFFNVIFEIKRHIFLVFLLLTLNIVFFYWVHCEQTYITAIYSLTETRLYLKFFLGFSAEPIRTRVNDIQVK